MQNGTDALHTWQMMLGLSAPWTVHGVSYDPQRRRCEVEVAFEAPRGWFRIRRQAQVPVVQQWRHHNFGNWAVHVLLRAPEGAQLEQLPWVGEPDLPFTRDLCRHLFALLREGNSLESIGTLLDLPLPDLWKLRYAIDNGRWREKDTVARPAASSAPAPGNSAAATLPDVRNPLWGGLLDGSIGLDIKALGLKLLLSRLRAQLTQINDPEVRMLKVAELHRYFLKNARQLRHEIEQLRAL